MLVVLLRGENCRFWSHLGWASPSLLHESSPPPTPPPARDSTQATLHLVILIVSRIQNLEWYWKQQFCPMERGISVWPTKITRPVKVAHFQRWSSIFRSDQTKMACSILIFNQTFPEFWAEWKVAHVTTSIVKCLGVYWLGAILLPILCLPSMNISTNHKFCLIWLSSISQ